jgi:DNA invertase Pin-like site-specific DNA recombinase
MALAMAQSRHLGIMTLAMAHARKAAKEELKRQRVRVADVEAREITALARDYLEAHPELVDAARPVVESWIASGRFGKRAQQQLEGPIHRHFCCAKLTRKMRDGMTTIGYARVSTDGQTLDAQQAALKAAGATEVYSEKVSGAVTERKALARAIASLWADDVLMVTRLDRLARSTRDLLNVLDAVAKRNAGFKSLADAWADTTTPHGRLMLTVLGGLAEFERELIRARTDEGRKRAQARGVQFGRKPKLTTHQRREALERRGRGEALVDIARSYAVSHSTISRL